MNVPGVIAKEKHSQSPARLRRAHKKHFIYILIENGGKVND